MMLVRVWGKGLHTAVGSVNLCDLFGGLSRICQNLQSITALTQQVVCWEHILLIFSQKNIKIQPQRYMLQLFSFFLAEQKTKNHLNTQGLVIFLHLFNKPPVVNERNKLDLTLTQGCHRDYWVKTQDVEVYVA